MDMGRQCGDLVAQILQGIGILEGVRD